jgi:hypothetical protein
LRKNGVYNSFSSYKEKILNLNYNSVMKDSEDMDYIINYFDNSFSLMKNLRYEFLFLFLKKSKKLKKIRTFIKNQKIIEHPNYLKFDIKKNYFNLPLPINTSFYVIFLK